MIGRPGLWPFHVIRILREIAQQDNKKAWHYAPSEVQVLVLAELDNDPYVRRHSWYAIIHEVERESITDDFRTYLLLLTVAAVSDEVILTEKQYRILLDLYHELPECFNLPPAYEWAYYKRLYYKGKLA